MKVVTKIIIRDKDSKILVLTRSDTHPNFAGHLDFPGGEVESGEDNTTAIIREVKEEINLDLDLANIKLLFDQKVNDNLTRLLYSYQLDETEPKLTISWEHSSYDWITEAELFSKQLQDNLDPYFRQVINYLKDLPQINYEVYI